MFDINHESFLINYSSFMFHINQINSLKTPTPPSNKAKNKAEKRNKTGFYTALRRSTCGEFKMCSPASAFGGGGGDLYAAEYVKKHRYYS